MQHDADDVEEIAASHDLGDYELFPDVPGVNLLRLSLAMKMDTIVVATKGNKWQFHKNDVDPWPSRLHGHHSWASVKLDAVTGDLFRINTRQHVGRIKPKELIFVQTRLLLSKDFSERTKELLGEARVAELVALDPKLFANKT